MKLLTTALVITLLTATFAKPVSYHEKNYGEGDLWSGYIKSSSFKDSSSSSDQLSASSESSESQSSEESSEEVIVIIQTTRPTTTGDMTTDPMITSAMTDITTGDGSTFTPDPKTDSTIEPGVTETTPPAGTATPTSSTSVTHCVTRDIPTAAPITENRGDN